MSSVTWELASTILGILLLEASCGGGGARVGGGRDDAGSGGNPADVVGAKTEVATGGSAGTGATVHDGDSLAGGGNTRDGGTLDGGNVPDAGRTEVGGTREGGADLAGTACEQVIATVDRSCTTDADCIAVSHQTDFIGQILLLGIRSSEMAHFSALEKSCQPTMKTFKPPTTMADDGSLVAGTASPAACQAAVCTTYAQACGHPCPAGHVCIACGNGAGAVSACSQVCSTVSCTEPPRTQCLGGASVNGGEGDFCFDPMFGAGFMSSSCHR